MKNTSFYKTYYFNDDLKIAYEHIDSYGRFALCLVVDYDTLEPIHKYGWLRLVKGFRCVKRNNAKFYKERVKVKYDENNNKSVRRLFKRHSKNVSRKP